MIRDQNGGGACDQQRVGVDAHTLEYRGGKAGGLLRRIRPPYTGGCPTFLCT